MKLIQQVRLFFKEGNSDKVYEIDLCELTAGKYLVNFRYGRRGNTLKEGTKTPASVSKEQADKLFAELESEKRKKGYQTELETFIPLPSLDDIDRKSEKGAILHRLQDALTGTKTFRTEWKTSRVIWKAGILQIAEAIPSILKLANRGDDMQLYCALWTLTTLKASQARSLFITTASNGKQKKHIRNICWEGLLTIANDDEYPSLSTELLAQLPEDLRYAIEQNKVVLTESQFGLILQEGHVQFLPQLYLLSRIHPWLTIVIVDHILALPFRPPYFKQIRAVYRLAQLRKDMAVIAALSYRFEKDGAMFRRTGPWKNERSVYIPEIGQSTKVGAMLKKEDSKLAFSHFTKEYFQKNSIEYLRNTGAQGDPKLYLRLAIVTLLQYSEADYTAPGERPLNTTGRYDYTNRVYRYTLVNYPECSGSLLLSTILFGNDTNRKLEPNLTYILGKRQVTSNKYFYSPNDVKPDTRSGVSVNRIKAKPADSKGGLVNTILTGLKGLFGKKAESPVPVTPSSDTSSPGEISDARPLAVDRKEIYPSHWDAMPEAYVQLLMQARMNIIHQFACDNLKAHPQFGEIINRFDLTAILQLLNSEFQAAGQFGYEVLRSRQQESLLLPAFVGKVLDCNYKLARDWAQTAVNANTDLYFNDLEFICLLLFNVWVELDPWINNVLTQIPFGEDRIQAILGKTTSELLHLENTGSNNELAKNAIARLQLFAAQQMEKVSWNIVGQLIASPLEANKILAGDILVKRSKHTAPTDIPISLTSLFLKSGIPEIRRNGIVLMRQYPNEFLADNLAFLLDHTETVFQDVTEAALTNIRRLLNGQDPVPGNTAILHAVYVMMRKEKFEGAHAMIGQFIGSDLKPYWCSGLGVKDITKLIHSQYRVGQLAGYGILKTYDKPEDLTMGQIISFGSHELLAIRQWCWSYFTRNVERVRREKDKALNLLDSSWEDTRAFAFQFFDTTFTSEDWDANTLIGIVDSVRPDVESFGKGLITRWFKEEHAMEYLIRLSEHPSVNVQAFISNYLSLYAAGKPELLSQLDFYFRSVLTRVNKGRVAKDHIFDFLRQEAVKTEPAAKWIAGILDDMVVQDTIRDKATCIDILSEIKDRYRHLDMHLVIKN